MRFRMLGSTGLQVSEIGFGTGGTAGLMVAGSFEQQSEAVARAIELGVNYFDTAPDYGDGVSETNLGRVLRELGVRPLITTKVEVREADLADIAGHVERSLEASLLRLGLDYVDIVQIHNGPTATATNLQGRDYRRLGIEDYFAAGGAIEGLERIRRAGKTRHLGFICRGNDGESVKRLLDTGLFGMINLVHTLINPTAAIAKPAGLDVDADFGQVIPYAREKGIGSAVYSPLVGGVLADRFVAGEAPHPLSGAGRDPAAQSERRRQGLQQAEALSFLSAGGDRSLAQAAVRFILMDEGVTTVLGGFSDTAQLEEIVAAVDTPPLEPAQLARVEALWRANFAA